MRDIGVLNVDKYNELPIALKKEIESANIFFQPAFVEFVHNNAEELYFFYNKERIVPLRHRKKACFNLGVFVSEPFLLVTDPAQSEGEFLDDVVYMAAQVLHIQWVNSTASCFFSDTPKSHCKRIPFGSHVINLSLERDILWKNVHGKHRNVIRKAEKESVTILSGREDLIKDYVELEQQTQTRTGRKASGLAYYKRQLDSLKNNIVIYIAYKDDKPQAGGIFYFNNQCCYYMYGATAKDVCPGSANLLIWKAINDMKDLGVREFSFVGCRINEDIGSKYSGIQLFKSRFGGELRQGYMFRYEKNPFMYKFFCKVMQLRLHSSKIYQDPIDEEIHKWKDIQVKNDD